MKTAILYPPRAFGPQRPAIRWDDVESYGLTGTDLVCVRYAEQLQRRGHDVTIYVDRGPDDGRFGDVKVRPWPAWREAAPNFDAALAVSYPDSLKGFREDCYRVVNRQVAGFVVGVDAQIAFDDFIDLYTCPSNAAVKIVSKGLPHPEKFRVLHNGVDLDAVSTEEKVPGKVIYSSSPDRGLHLLLSQWPKIRKAVPHATLEVFYYSLQEWLDTYTHPHKVSTHPLETEIMRRAQYVKHALAKLQDVAGVTVVGGVSHRQMQAEYARAEVLAYPCQPIAFTETFGVSVLEAMAAGCVPVITTADAFEELWCGACPHVEHPAIDRIGEWSDLVIHLLEDGDDRECCAHDVRSAAAEFTWDASGEKLDGWMREGVQAKHRVEVTSKPVLHMVMSDYSQGDEAVDPRKPFDRQTGGGAPTEYMGMALEMADLGYEAKVFAKFTKPERVRGVEFLQIEDAGMHGKPDALLAFYDTRLLHALPAKRRIACHLTFQVPFPEVFELADANTAPSMYTVDALRRVFGGNGWDVLPNSLIPDVPEWRPIEGRVFSHMVTDRGLHHLFAAWPKVRAAVPTATLHVLGKVEEWAEAHKDLRGPRGDRARFIRDTLPGAMDAGGLTILPPLSRAALMQELSKAAVFAFPCDPARPCETFSRSTLEALAVGVPAVLLEADALRYVYNGVVHFAAKQTFAEKLVEVMKVPRDLDQRADERSRGKDFAARHSFAENAKALDKIIRKCLAG